MIKYLKGDLLHAPTQALVNTVNTVGVMGKGVALQFRNAYPDNYQTYIAACKQGKVQIGKILVHDRGDFAQPRYILNFPTKKHWRNPSKLEYVQEGLVDLVRVIQERNIGSVAIPPLGVGNGKLDWEAVRFLIEAAFRELPEVEVLVYPPQPETHHDIARATKRPHLTPARAAVLKLFALYSALGEPMGRLEAQKLAYFLQEAGLQLKLPFTKHRYGPYAENLNHVLQRLEGHYIGGYGDRNTRSRMHLLPGALDEAVAFLADHPKVDEAVQKVAELIEGFETPYGLELLATVHWVVAKDGAHDQEALLREIRGWNDRKALFQEEHLIIAWEHLKQNRWLVQGQPSA